MDRALRVWRWIRIPTGFGLGLAIGFGVPYLLYLDRLVRERFADFAYLEPSRVYARPLELKIGMALNMAMLTLELQAARYERQPAALQPGTYRAPEPCGNDCTIDIATRAFSGVAGLEAPRHLQVRIAGGKAAGLRDLDAQKAVDQAWVDPARIATFYGGEQEERRFVPLKEIPELLKNTLLAVEDRDFYHHRGVSLWAISRALWADLRAGELVQGGSTLTQQLVRNLFLDRSQTIKRKLNEVLLALLIEARFSKARILEAYLNEVYLGQQGGQAVHGVAAASEFYFGRDLAHLGVAETALLIGLIQGPSLHNPRRYPKQAESRRATVLQVMQSQGLINAMDREIARKQGLGAIQAGALPKNRYPAFLDLVKTQIAGDFPDSKLHSEGLVVLTTLAPSTQLMAEQAVQTRMKAMGKQAGALEVAMVVSRTDTGAVEAMIGGKKNNEIGFNRAIRAARPIGSLVKPFVYLTALAQPEYWSLGSILSDTRISLQLPNRQVWSPDNVDGQEHGDVALIDALAHSYNLATVRLGMTLGVEKIERVLEALIPGADIQANPSLLLGAAELSPFQVAQAYQYLAADGHAIRPYAVDRVLDAKGQALSRYVKPPSAGDLVNVARLVGFALQTAARSGTAHELADLGLGHLQAAGKTGTSNDQRDSWFAGFTGSHLAVVWLGTDDNQRTSLYGSTGAMRVWAALFKQLPTKPLRLALDDDPQLAWVDPQTQELTHPDCPNARQLPFLRGYEPPLGDDCFGPSWDDAYSDEHSMDADDDERDEGNKQRKEKRRKKFWERVRDWIH